jgi:hypothetical protein
MTQFRRSSWVRLVGLALVGLLTSGVAGVGGAWADHVLLIAESTNINAPSPAFNRNAIVFQRKRSNLLGPFVVDAQRVIRFSESDPFLLR